MASKKAIENTLLAVIGIGLITTAVVLLSKKSPAENKQAENSKPNLFEDYDTPSNNLHVFSEAGILL